MSSSNKKFDPETGAVIAEVITPQLLKSNVLSDKKELRKKDEPVVFTNKKSRGHPFCKPQIMLVQGRTGSGKSTVVFTILNEILEAIDEDKFNKILFYSGSDGDPLLKRLNPNYVKLYGSKEASPFIDDLRDLMATSYIDESSGHAKLTVVVVDDGSNNETLAPTKSKGSVIGDLAVSHRHCNTILIYVSQRYMQAPVMLRANASRLFLFSGSTKSEIKSITRDLPFEADQLEKAMAMIGSKPHEFISAVVPTRCILRGFDQVLFK